MKSHNELSDQEFSEAFASKTLDPSLFSHEAHLRLAHYYISTYGLVKATLLLKEQIKEFDQTFGDGTKYNEEITVISARVMAKLGSTLPKCTFEELLQSYPRLMEDFKSLLKEELNQVN